MGALACLLIMGIFMVGCGKQEDGGPLSSASDRSAFAAGSASEVSPEQGPSVVVPEGPESAPQETGGEEGDGEAPFEESGDSSAPMEQPGPESTNKEADTEMKLKLQIGESTFQATLENNAAVDAFVEMMQKEPVVIRMRDYSGFEKVGSLGAALPAGDYQTTTGPGDIVLYNRDQIVIFYGSNSWSYTRLGRVDDLTGWADALGSGDVTVTFSLAG